MSRPEARRDEWERLLAERAAARAELVGALGRLDARARDPLRLKETIRRHPLAAAGIAAGAGALLVRLLAPADARTDTPRTQPPTAADDGPSFLDGLRDAALRAAAPLVARFVEEHLGDGRLSAAPEEVADHGA